MSWQQHYQEQIELRNQAYYAFADRLLTLSTGALALSIAFRQSFSAASPAHLWLLETSWTALIITVVTSLIVQFGRVTSHGNMARALRKSQNTSAFVSSSSGWWFIPAGFLMLGSFPVAIIALTAFALTNLK